MPRTKTTGSLSQPASSSAAGGAAWASGVGLGGGSARCAASAQLNAAITTAVPPAIHSVAGSTRVLGFELMFGSTREPRAEGAAAAEPRPRDYRTAASKLRRTDRMEQRRALVQDARPSALRVAGRFSTW